ncbi:predicted protein [Uncinocarpus reesii 1704]|uniref:Uncharacterized protein n=1 Tax=Uncinocarpus reesii (strain UAMH 1704) TaxID=336963 RepID=C4JPU8_UNCRE|nr:uncharacterized protein UREG_04591 [Uncinocarpus reesii 1704]EEP79745.1 predicted protein [Uncinocarpus reesii 1704]
MSDQWMNLPSSWSLQNVQAVLTVVVSALSALMIWVTTRTFWRRGAIPVTKESRTVPILSLLTISSLGEVFDTLKVFKLRVLSVRYLAICVQCIVVVIFSLSGMLSGPIARFSSRMGVEERGQEKIVSALVKWNETQQSLTRAGFPTDQLLDFLPDPSRHWFYREDEWNSSWSARCDFIPATPVELQSTGNRSDTLLYTQVSGLKDLTPERFHNKSVYLGRYQLAAFEENRGNYRDVLLFVLRYPDGWTRANFNWDKRMSFSILSVHMHNAPRPSDMDGDGISFGEGKIEKASYTRTDCDLTRIEKMPDDLQFAYPHTLDADSIVQAYADYYRPNLIQQSIANASISPPSPEELFQFYQVYMITKDTQLPHSVQRVITVEVPTVELSIAWLAVVLFFFCVVILGLILYIVFLFKQRSRLSGIPNSKLDWMAISIKEATGQLNKPDHIGHTNDQDKDATEIVRPTQPMESTGQTTWEQLKSAKFGPIRQSSGSLGTLKIQLP